MASADIVVLRVIRIERGGVDLANQRLLCSSDRSRVVDLREVRHAQYWRRLREQMADGAQTDDFSRR